MHAGLGSIDIAANMRSVLFLAEDPDDPMRRIIGHSKSNNVQRGKSVAYAVETVIESILTPDGDTVTIEAPKLKWDGLSALSADDLSSPPPVDEEEKGAVDQAREFLIDLLRDGPVLSDEVEAARNPCLFSGCLYLI